MIRETVLRLFAYVLDVIACIWETRNACEVLFEKSRGNRYLWRLILQSILKTLDVKVLTEFTCLELRFSSGL